MGGSTMKTAKVWRYFDQLPTEEQAAECKICCKKIKATNSSTTGMIRHLRSCHVNEYQLLQEARQNGLILKQEEKSRSTVPKQPIEIKKQKPKEISAHTIANLIASPQQEVAKCAIESCSTQNKPIISNDMPPVLKKAKYEECNAVDLRIEKTTTASSNRSSSASHANSQDRRPYQKPAAGARLSGGTAVEKTRSVLKEASFFWPEDHPDAKRITNQVGLMLLLDNESPAAVDRAGFRGLLRLLEPKYRMPSAEKFQKVIIPQIFNQLKSDLVGFQQSFFQNNPFGVDTSSNVIDASTLAQFTKPMLQQHKNALNVQPEQCELDRVVINSIRSAQNISQSFSHSIQLCDEESESSTDPDSVLLSRIDTFLERIGKYVFPQTEVVELLRRCYGIVRHLENSPEDATTVLGAAMNGTQSADLSKCIEFVANNLAAIHALHSHRPFTSSFKPFSSEEAQFLSDLNAHVSSTL